MFIVIMPLSSCVSNGPPGDGGPNYYDDQGRPPVRTEAGPPPPPAKLPLPEVVNSLSTRVEKNEDLTRNVTSSMEKRLGLMEKEMTSLRGEVEQLQHAKSRLEAELEAKNKQALAQQQAAAAQQAAAQQTSGAVDMSSPDYDPADQGQDDSANMDEQPPNSTPAFTQPAAPTTKVAKVAPVVASEKKGPTKPKPESSKQAYEEAFSLLKGGRYDESLSAFKNYMEWFPNDGLADNAQYWIGELYYVQRKFPDALMAFNQVLVRWPSSGKIPASLLKIGFAFYELGDMENAKNSLTRLISDYPESPAVAMAKQRLEMVEERAGKH
ncbi:MAG: tol-pal system protein YbgF [Magnetococcales bacterium]|nr:tol-pal system protein YbgF [Magnetococcales bacterium]MBF0149353.1 tol-pal system protein YbgF [Magnetococcales bacterium]MBF0172999.1 tol-pal system protein YbgF [Magnetococcales bacterium]MBF0630938.1 tol-pal system protein YbgF [Magnetococcales bacterium]